jgi:hypothetical protein
MKTQAFCLRYFMAWTAVANFFTGKKIAHECRPDEPLQFFQW